jgi:hypothetical protein
LRKQKGRSFFTNSLPFQPTFFVFPKNRLGGVEACFDDPLSAVLQAFAVAPVMISVGIGRIADENPVVCVGTNKGAKEKEFKYHGHYHRLKAMLQDHRLKPMLQDHRLKPMLQDHRLKAMLQDHRLKPMLHFFAFEAVDLDFLVKNLFLLAVDQRVQVAAITSGRFGASRKKD